MSSLLKEANQLFRDGVIPTLALATHGQGDPELGGQGGEVAAGVLTAAVGVEDHPGRWGALGAGHAQGIGDEIGAHVIGSAQPTTRREARSMTVAR